MNLHSVIEKTQSLLNLLQLIKLKLVIGCEIILVINAGWTRLQLFLFVHFSLQSLLTDLIMLLVDGELRLITLVGEGPFFQIHFIGFLLDFFTICY